MVLILDIFFSAGHNNIKFASSRPAARVKAETECVDLRHDDDSLSSESAQRLAATSTSPYQKNRRMADTPATSPSPQKQARLSGPVLSCGTVAELSSGDLFSAPYAHACDFESLLCMSSQLHAAIRGADAAHARERATFEKELARRERTIAWLRAKMGRLERRIERIENEDGEANEVQIVGGNCSR